MTAHSTPPRGHWPTLVGAFLHFDLCFMLWVLLGALGIYIAESVGLSPAEKGLMVATPILSGALLRFPVGVLSDRLGGKRVGAAMLALLFIPLFLGWRGGETLPALLGIGLLLGTAGASFAVALPLASRWYPAERQGLVMGIAAAGNSGTVLANLLAPRLANVVGWHGVLGLAMIPLAVVLVAFLLMAKDPARVKPTRVSQDLRILAHADLWWMCLFYSVTFGGYVGLSSFLPLLFRDQYHVAPLAAGQLTALAALLGSLARPIGGWLADRIGGVRLLSILLAAIAGAYMLAARPAPLASMAGLMVFTMACLGMGNGAVFQLVPQRFSDQIGVATGMVGAIGGLGGFLLPNLLGQAKQASGAFGPGFIALGLLAVTALVALRVLSTARSTWRSSWQAQPAPADASQ